jgi:hypothetical protein
LFKNHKTIFSIVDEPPSWSDADDSFESILDPEEVEDDMPDDKDSSRSSVGDGDAEGDVVAEVVADGDADACEDEEGSSDDFFDAGKGVVTPDRLSECAASESESGKNGGGTKDGPVGPVTPSAGGNTLQHNSIPTTVHFSRTISSGSADLDDEDCVDSTPIPATRLEPAPTTATDHREGQVIQQRQDSET